MSKSLARNRALVILAGIALGASGALEARPVTWATSGVAFADGSFLVGGITYDAAKNSYSDILIFAFGGSISGDVAFPYWNPSFPVSPNFISLVQGLPNSDLTGSPSLLITLASSLAEPGVSSVSCPVALLAQCTDPICSSVDQFTSLAAFGGELLSTSTPVPEPSGVLTLSAAILALAGWRAVRSRRGGRYEATHPATPIGF